MEERQYIYYKVKSGNSLGSIAANHRVSINDLKQWNNLKGSMIHPGQILKVMLPPGSSVQVAKSSPQATPKPVAGSQYEVQSGDTLWSIAKKFDGLTTEKLISLNNLSNSKITPGQKLLVK
jgi:membrane-bound lytic murein transglycosylase D